MMHTVWLRYHNFWASTFSARGKGVEESYVLAKAQVISDLDAVLFNEALPTIIGEYADCSQVNPIDQVDRALTDALLRVAHTTVNEDVITQLGKYGVNSLQDMFFNPSILVAAGGNLHEFVYSLYHTPAHTPSVGMATDLNRMLFKDQPAPPHSLFLMNLLRGDDNKVPRFNDVREAWNLTRYTSFKEFVSRNDTLILLEEFFPGGPDDCPTWLCGAAEDPDHPHGSSFGQTVSTVFQQQFCGIRRKPSPGPEKPLTFSRILCLTTNACNLPSNVFTGQDKGGFWAFWLLSLLSVAILLRVALK